MDGSVGGGWMNEQRHMDGWRENYSAVLLNCTKGRYMHLLILLTKINELLQFLTLNWTSQGTGSPRSAQPTVSAPRAPRFSTAPPPALLTRPPWNGLLVSQIFLEKVKLALSSLHSRL